MASHIRIIWANGASEEFTSPLSPADAAEKLSWGVSLPMSDGGHFYAEHGALRSFTVHDLPEVPGAHTITYSTGPVILGPLK
jgi:hypothetical protein